MFDNICDDINLPLKLAWKHLLSLGTVLLALLEDISGPDISDVYAKHRRVNTKKEKHVDASVWPICKFNIMLQYFHFLFLFFFAAESKLYILRNRQKWSICIWRRSKTKIANPIYPQDDQRVNGQQLCRPIFFALFIDLWCNASCFDPPMMWSNKLF